MVPLSVFLLGSSVSVCVCAQSFTVSEQYSQPSYRIHDNVDMLSAQNTERDGEQSEIQYATVIFDP